MGLKGFEGGRYAVTSCHLGPDMPESWKALLRWVQRRSAILASIVALTLATGELQADPPKSLRVDVGPGRIAWSTGSVLRFRGLISR